MDYLKTFKVFIFYLVFVHHFVSAQDVKEVNYEVTPIGGNAYIFTRVWDQPYSRANMGVVVGERGVLLINPFYTEEVPQLLKKIKELTDLPIQYVLNSNGDKHNTHANKYFHDLGAQIISHENLKYHPETFTELTFSDQLNLYIGNEQITAYRSYGHSFEHINIHLHQANVTFMSDSYRSQWMTIEGPYGLAGHFKGIDRALSMGNEDTKYVPGNTSSKIFSLKADLINEKEKRKQFADRVILLRKNGLLNEEILSDSIVKKIMATYEMYPYFKNEIGDWVINPIIKNQQSKEQALSKSQGLKYIGWYSSSEKPDIEVFWDNNQLYARSLGRFYHLLTRVSDSAFWYDEQILDLTMDFEKTEEGYASALSFEGTKFIKIKTQSP